MAEKTVRINLEVPAKYREKLKALQKKHNAASQQEVFRKAVHALELLDDLQAQGQLKLHKPNGDIETIRIIS